MKMRYSAFFGPAYGWELLDLRAAERSQVEDKGEGDGFGHLAKYSPGSDLKEDNRLISL